MDNALQQDQPLVTIRDLVNLLLSRGYPMRKSGHKGVIVILPNRYQVSIQCGPMNYCDHYNMPMRSVYGEDRSPDFWFTSTTAEIAIFKPNGDFYVPPHALERPEWAEDDPYWTPPTSWVEGWQSPQDILAWIEKAEQFDKLPHSETKELAGAVT